MVVKAETQTKGANPWLDIISPRGTEVGPSTNRFGMAVKFCTHTTTLTADNPDEVRQLLQQALANHRRQHSTNLSLHQSNPCKPLISHLCLIFEPTTANPSLGSRPVWIRADKAKQRQK